MIQVLLSATTAMAQAAEGAAAKSPSLVEILPMPLGFLVIMYFMIIRPQQKKAKEQADLLNNLKAGDEVVTSGGVLGTVSKIGDNYVGLEVAQGVEVQIQRSAVVQVLPKGTLK